MYSLHQKTNLTRLGSGVVIKTSLVINETIMRATVCFFFCPPLFLLVFLLFSRFRYFFKSLIGSKIQLWGSLNEVLVNFFCLIFLLSYSKRINQEMWSVHSHTGYSANFKFKIDAFCESLQVSETWYDVVINYQDFVVTLLYGRS